MGVQITKSGGIYIEISANYTKLQDDLKAVHDLSKVAGANIAKALGDSIDPGKISGAMTDLTRSLMKAQEAGKALTSNFAAQEKAIREWGQMAGMSGKNLDSFVALQIKAFQTKYAKDFGAELRSIQRQTGATDKEMQALAKSMGGTGEELNKAATASRNLCINWTEMALAAAGAKLVTKAASLALSVPKESFDLAARYETLGVVVQQVGKVAGYSAVEIDKNVNAIRRMGIAGTEARQTMAQLIQSQVDISKTPQLARIAQDAAVIGGVNSSEAFERLVHGIQSANTQTLRGIGINVNFEDSYKSLAARLGKTTDELTEQEKTQARVNAVIESGKTIVGAYEAAMGTLGKQLSSLPRIQQDLATDFGKFMLPPFRFLLTRDNRGALRLLFRTDRWGRAEASIYELALYLVYQNFYYSLSRFAKRRRSSGSFGV